MFGATLLTALVGAEEVRASRVFELLYENEQTLTAANSFIECLTNDAQNSPKFDEEAVKELIESVKQLWSKLDTHAKKVIERIHEPVAALDPKTNVLVGYAQRDLVRSTQQPKERWILETGEEKESNKQKPLA